MIKKRIVVHCTGNSFDFNSALNWSIENERQRVEDICAFWKNDNKWQHVGYHAIVMPSGTIHVLCNPFTTITNGAKGYNSESIHIAYYGGFHQDMITEIQISALADYCRYLLVLSGLDVDHVFGHCDLPGVKKACPNIDMNHLRNMIKEDKELMMLMRIVSTPHYVL